MVKRYNLNLFGFLISSLPRYCEGNPRLCVLRRRFRVLLQWKQNPFCTLYEKTELILVLTIIFKSEVISFMFSILYQIEKSNILFALFYLVEMQNKSKTKLPNDNPIHNEIKFKINLVR